MAAPSDAFNRKQERSPTSATLLREPLLRSSANTVTVRVQSVPSRERLKPASSKASNGSDSPLARGPGFLVSVRRLPREVWVVLAIDFLNSYRSFGFRSVQYQYLTNEFGLSDLDAGSYLGMQAWLLVIFGMVGAMLVDAWGVRKTALWALSVASVSRGILTFTTDENWMLISLLGLAPFGEAVLSTGIYTVALKKLTTVETRAFAFGVQYSIFNLAGAMADTAADVLRRHDFVVGHWLPFAEYLGGSTWSGLRMHVFVTWLAVLLCLAIAVPFLHDSVLIPLQGPPSPFLGLPPSSPPPLSDAEVAALRAGANAAQRERGYVIAPLPRGGNGNGDGQPQLMQRNLAPSPIFGRANIEALKTASSPRTWLNAARNATGRAAENTRNLCALPEFWRALWLSCCLFFLSKQWGDMDQLLPPFLERHFGVGAPIYTSAHRTRRRLLVQEPPPMAPPISFLALLLPRPLRHSCEPCKPCEPCEPRVLLGMQTIVPANALPWLFAN